MKKSIQLLLVGTILTSLNALASAPASSPALLEKGKAAYVKNCVLCHGDTGKGDGIAGKALKPTPRNFITEAFKGKDGKGKLDKPTVDQVYDVLTNGIAGTMMAPFKHLSEDERWGMSYYVLKLRNGK